MSETNSYDDGICSGNAEIDEVIAEAMAPLAESIEDGNETEDESENEAANEGAEMRREITASIVSSTTTEKLSPLKSVCFSLMAIIAFFIAFGAVGTLFTSIGIGGGKASSASPTIEQFAPPPLFTADKWLLDAEKDAARAVAREVFTQMSNDEANLIGAGCLAGAFGAWTPCAADGTQSRQRFFDSGISFGGKACPHALETRECEGASRCVGCDGGAFVARGLFTQMPNDEANLTGAGCLSSAFGAWTPCTADGIQSRQRFFDSGISFGGKACPHTLETRECEGRCVNSTENARDSLLPKISDLKRTSQALAPNGSAAFLTCVAATGLAQCAPGIF
jgi:hypothetical protein